MSRSNQYTKHNSSALHGTPLGEFSIELDVSELSATEEINIHDSFSAFAQVVSCQVVGKNLGGTLNGVLTLTQSNDGANFDSITTSTTSIISSDASSTIEKGDFSGKFLGVLLEKGGITSGTISLYFIVKHN